MNTNARALRSRVTSTSCVNVLSILYTKILSITDDYVKGFLKGVPSNNKKNLVLIKFLTLLCSFICSIFKVKQGYNFIHKGVTHIKMNICNNNNI